MYVCLLCARPYTAHCLSHMRSACVCTASYSISIYYTSWEFAQVYLHLYLFFILYFFLPSFDSFTLALSHSVTLSLSHPFGISLSFGRAVCRFHFILALLAANVVCYFNRSTETSCRLQERKKKAKLLPNRIRQSGLAFPLVSAESFLFIASISLESLGQRENRSKCSRSSGSLSLLFSYSCSRTMDAIIRCLQLHTDCMYACVHVQCAMCNVAWGKKEDESGSCARRLYIIRIRISFGLH